METKKLSTECCNIMKGLHNYKKFKTVVILLLKSGAILNQNDEGGGGLQKSLFQLSLSLFFCYFLRTNRQTNRPTDIHI